MDYGWWPCNIGACIGFVLGVVSLFVWPLSDKQQSEAK